MAVQRKQNFLGGQRVDVPHLRSIESGVAADFANLVNRFISSGQINHIIRGFSHNAESVDVEKGAWAVTVADSVILSQTDGICLYTFPSDAEVIYPLQSGTFDENTDYYVGIRISSVTHDPQVVKFIDDVTNTEISKTVPLAIILDYEVQPTATSTNSDPNTIWIYKVKSVGGLITASNVEYPIGTRYPFIVNGVKYTNLLDWINGVAEAPVSGPAGGVLGYTGSTYPDPNGLSATEDGLIKVKGYQDQKTVTIKGDDGTVDLPDGTTINIVAGIESETGDSGDVYISAGQGITGNLTGKVSLYGTSKVELFGGPETESRIELSSSGVKVNNAYTLPAADGAANEVLTTDGAGSLSWGTNSAAPSGPAGGILGYTGSTYPDPNGLAGGTIPIKGTSHYTAPNQPESTDPMNIVGDQAPGAAIGYALNITASKGGNSAAYVGAGGTGGALTLSAGAGGDGTPPVAGAGAGGQASLLGGDAGATNGMTTSQKGGDVLVRGGAGTGSYGGAVNIVGGNGGNGTPTLAASNGGDVNIEGGLAGTSAAGGGNGGAVLIASGYGEEAGGAGGTVTILSRSGGAGTATVVSGDGGNIVINCGVAGFDGGAGGGSGGSLSISSGDGASAGGSAGNISIVTGNGGDASQTLELDAGSAGSLTIALGNGGNNDSAALGSDGGSFSLTAGKGFASGNKGGGVDLNAGTAKADTLIPGLDSTGGRITLDGATRSELGVTAGGTTWIDSGYSVETDTPEHGTIRIAARNDCSGVFLGVPYPLNSPTPTYTCDVYGPGIDAPYHASGTMGVHIGNTYADSVGLGRSGHDVTLSGRDVHSATTITTAGTYTVDTPLILVQLGSSGTVTLNNGVSVGTKVTVLNLNNNTVTVAAVSTFHHITNHDSLNQYSSISLVWAGSAWIEVGSTKF